jgi:hypothetical protein
MQLGNSSRGRHSGLEPESIFLNNSSFGADAPRWMLNQVQHDGSQKQVPQSLF